MASFRYRLQALLDAFAERERLAQADLARALGARASSQAELIAWDRRTDELRRARPLVTQARFPAELDRAVTALACGRARRRDALRSLQAWVERAQAEAGQAGQRRRAFERHRQRALATHAVEQALRESEELDETNAGRRGPGVARCEWPMK